MNYKLRDTFLEDGFYVTQNYFARPEYYAQFNLLGHEGVDFGHSDKKRLVRSPLSGTCFVATDKNYGNFVVVEDYQQQCAIYLCHLENLVVDNGQEIKAGDAVGEMGMSGNSTGEHVHCNFVILKDGSNKYHAKKWNWGYLDLLYPRDTGETRRFDGVEDYSISWGPGTTPESTQLSQCEKDLAEQRQQVSNLQTQVNGLLNDIAGLKGALSAEETKNGTLGGRIQELTKQNDDLSSQLGSANSTIQALTSKVESLNVIVGQYQKEDAVQIEDLRNAQDKQKLVEDQYSLTLYEAEEILKLQHTSDALQVRAVAVLDALQKLRDGKEKQLSVNDYQLLLVIGGNVIWQKRQ